MNNPECYRVSRSVEWLSCNSCSNMGENNVIQLMLGTLLIRVCDDCMKGIFKRWRKETQTQRMYCGRCGGLNDQYMVKPRTWAEARFGIKELVCLKCLENELNRPLSIGDFTKAQINDTIRWAFELGSKGK